MWTLSNGLYYIYIYPVQYSTVVLDWIRKAICLSNELQDLFSFGAVIIYSELVYLRSRLWLAKFMTNMKTLKAGKTGAHWNVMISLL